MAQHSRRTPCMRWEGGSEGRRGGGEGKGEADATVGGGAAAWSVNKIRCLLWNHTNYPRSLVLPEWY
uniref:Uncharacterized protein n=2 Tax=Oryza sativa subsp. japonica TaxID=39947 RepID=Q7G6M7_ORYSJ|nr:hypothetical protein [Oryza sativa Japonica Group]AAM94542.1 hypothetical protein [Oryza sativa Japonica Group]AAP54746.1 hypothetical protein LOC_Os10g38510 [Oryza sativa Japonica Group]